jgi:hypothetical protein
LLVAERLLTELPAAWPLTELRAAWPLTELPAAWPLTELPAAWLAGLVPDLVVGTLPFVTELCVEEPRKLRDARVPADFAADRIEPDAASAWEIGCVKLLIAEPPSLEAVVALPGAVRAPANFPAPGPDTRLAAELPFIASPPEVEAPAVSAPLLAPRAVSALVLAPVLGLALRLGVAAVFLPPVGATLVLVSLCGLAIAESRPPASF